jgi:hypothetical protein
MLSTKPLAATHATARGTVTATFYPDNGCLRFSTLSGSRLHELMPPHSWMALSSVSAADRSPSHQPGERELSLLLAEFAGEMTTTAATRRQRPAR